MFKRKLQLQSINQRRYNYWQALFMSFYSRKLYIDVAKNWKGFGFLYFFIVLVLVIIPFSTRSTLAFNQYFENDIIYPIKNIPTFDIVNGHVNFTQKMPYVIKNKTNEPVVIIDTTGKFTKIDKKYPKLMMLITDQNYFFRAPHLPIAQNIQSLPLEENEIDQQSFKEIDDGTFTASHWLETHHLKRLKQGMLIMIYPTLLFAFYGLYTVLILMFAITGQIMSRLIFKFTIHFQPACRIMVMASGVGLSFFFILKSTNLVIPWLGFYTMLIIGGYFSFGILSLKRQSGQLVFA